MHQDCSCGVILAFAINRIDLFAAVKSGGSTSVELVIELHELLIVYPLLQRAVLRIAKSPSSTFWERG